MDARETYQRLLALDPYEQIGLKYYQATGKMLDYTYLIYLPMYIKESDPLTAMEAAAARAKMDSMKAQFRQNYHAEGLSEEDFFTMQKNIEMKVLTRYFHIPTHKHAFVELVYVVSGTCTHTIGEFHTTHTAGDFILVPPGVTHELVPVEDCLCITTQMRKSVFLNSFSDLLRSNSLLSAYFNQVLNLPYYHCALSFHCGQDEFLVRTLLSAFEQQEKGQEYSDNIIKSLWQVFFCYLLQNYQDTVEFLVSNMVQHAQMAKILNYIFENYQNITLSSAAQHFYFSVPYFSTLIRTQTGKNFSDLLKSYKLQRAAELLEKTNLKLDMICEEVGYNTNL